MPTVQCAAVNNLKQAITEMVKAGVAPETIEAASARAVFRCLRIWNIGTHTAAAIKEAMLRGGGEASVSAKAEHAASIDMLLFGTMDNFRTMLTALHIPAGGGELRACAERIKNVLMNVEGTVPPDSVKWRGRSLCWGEKTLIMGIINVTPDSFYSASRRRGPAAALDAARDMLTAGADILDIGGESTRPGAEPVSAEEERNRVIPTIKLIRKEFHDAIISIDTYRATTAAAALEAGADIINDISALAADSDMAIVAADAAVPVCIMHIQGTPRNMQQNPHYEKDAVGEIISFLAHRIEFATEAGIAENRIIVDPGIGFGKTAAHNLEIIARLEEFHSLGRPLLIGASRKSFIGKTLDLPEDERLEGSLAVAVLAAAKGAHILRVHDVAPTARALKMADAVAGCH